MADEITLTLEPPYIGSAYSPQVTVEEIEGGHSVTITSDVPGEGIVAQTFDVLDGDASQAIEDAEAAAAAARAAASSASSAAATATNAAGAASTAAGQASTAAGAATDAASAATGAAASATAAAADATEAAGLADDATAAATAAASNAGTATREAIAATTAANNAAATANAAAGSAAIAAADATTAAGTATDAATSATGAASAAGTAADAANTAATAANAAAEAATEAAEGIQEDLAAKADKTGTYSTLTAGGTTPDSVTDAMLVQKGGVLEKVGSIFAEADLSVSVRSIAGATAYEGYNGFVSSGAGIGLNTLTAGMDSYVVIATEDMDIWFDGITANYVAITYGSDYTSTYAGDGYYIVRCSSPTRLRSSDGNLPTAESKLHIAAGSAVCFTIRQGQSQTVYGFVTDTIVRESFANEVLSYAPQPESQKRMLVQKYVSSTGYDLYVYVPASVGYVLYDLRLVENASINSHIWHMSQAVHVPDSLDINQSVALTTSGEWEIAIHLQGRDDFSGGSAHGDQMLVGDPIFMVDGVIAAFADLPSTPTECDEIILLQTSNMYDPADHETVIAIEACQHKWTRDGLEVRQSLCWQGAYTLTSSYLAMFPPAKAQTDHAYLDSDMTAQAIADVYGEHENTQWACVYGASNGVRMEFWVDKYPNASGEIFLMTDNNGGAYNKCYFYAVKGSQTTPPQVTSGTLWKSVTRYRIEVGA